MASAREVEIEAPSTSRAPYRDLIGSLAGLLRAVPELRTASLCQALGYGSFMVFWLGATLYLRSPAFGWTPQAIGLVALVAAAAASAAPMFGRAIDRSGPHAARRTALIGMVLAWVLLAAFEGHLAGMAAGLVVLDISATVLDISNRTILYGLDASIRTRLNAVYQVAMFSGGAVMSVLVPVTVALLRCWRGCSIADGRKAEWAQAAGGVVAGALVPFLPVSLRSGHSRVGQAVLITGPALSAPRSRGSGNVSWSAHRREVRRRATGPWGPNEQGNQSRSGLSASERHLGSPKDAERGSGAEAARVGRAGRLQQRNRSNRREGPEGPIVGVGDVLHRGENL